MSPSVLTLYPFIGEVLSRFPAARLPELAAGFCVRANDGVMEGFKDQLHGLKSPKALGSNFQPVHTTEYFGLT